MHRKEMATLVRCSHTAIGLPFLELGEFLNGRYAVEGLRLNGALSDWGNRANCAGVLMTYEFEHIKEL